MGFRTNYRDLEEWKASTNNEIDLNTQSNEAAKMYDATISQFCGWYEDENLGGMGKSLELMIQADPNFLLGRALEAELKIMGGMDSPQLNANLAKSVTDLNYLLARKEEVSDLERFHVDVVNHWAKNQIQDVTRVLERLVTFYPNDIAALKMLQDSYFVLGQPLKMRNSLAGSLPKIPERNPLKGYAHGMFAFAFEEANMYDESQEQVKKSLALIPHDTWAIHNNAHCLEMQAKTDEGMNWMYDKQADWKNCNLLACHQYWHTALFHINKGQYDEAIDLLDREVLSRCTNGATSLNLHDGVSMVYRMELIDLFKLVRNENGDSVKKRWSNIYETCKPHKADHLWAFNDAHYMMAFLGMDDMGLAREFIDSLDEAPNMCADIGKTIVKPLLEAMYQFKAKDYAKCVDLLEEIRFDVIKIGGSHAQRDIFEQLLVVAALKSDKPSHNKLGQRMLTERDQLQGERTNQTRLLAYRALAAE